MCTQSAQVSKQKVEYAQYGACGHKTAKRSQLVPEESTAESSIGFLV